MFDYVARSMHGSTRRITSTGRFAGYIPDAIWRAFSSALTNNPGSTATANARAGMLFDVFSAGSTLGVRLDVDQGLELVAAWFALGSSATATMPGSSV